MAYKPPSGDAPVDSHQTPSPNGEYKPKDTVANDQDDNGRLVVDRMNEVDSELGVDF